MPWKSKADVARHNKAAAADPAKRKQFESVANAVLAKTGSDAIALRTASGVVKNHPARHMHGDGAPGSHWSRK